MSSRLNVLVREVGALRRGPVPRAAMLRSGCAIGAGFLTFLAMRRAEVAVVCAIFANFLCLTDKAQALPSRLWVQGIGAAISIGAAAVGALIAGNDPLILVTTFAFALFAGFVHGTLPGVEAIPRYALCCFVAAAFLPIANLATLAAAMVATGACVMAVRVDHHLRHGIRGIRVARDNSAVKYPGPQFSLLYAIAAAASLAVGILWTQRRPYWVMITTLLVMQPDRRANTVRVIQRFVGTILGVVAAFAITRSIDAAIAEPAFLALALALPFLWPLGFDRNYGLGIALMSTWIMLLINSTVSSGEPVSPLFFERLSDTALGCAVALAGSFAVQESAAD